MSAKLSTRILVCAAVLTAFATSQASAQTYKAQPWTFVGKLAQCFPSAAGAKIVFSNWLSGAGLPDNGNPNPSGKNPHQGLLLNKNGPTPNCSSAGATIVEDPALDTWVPKPIDGLGFDYRSGSHCGNGAPRFNVYTNASFTEGFFFGCGFGTHTAAPQDSEWVRVRFADADGAPFGGATSFVFGATTVYWIDIVYDEGTDTASEDTLGVGLAVLDNIFIDATLIRDKKTTPIVP
jgi:hypothetical protein